MARITDSVLLVLMERAFRGPTHEGVRTLDWQPQLKRVLRCVREHDPLFAAMRERIGELENELVAGVHTCNPACRKTPRCAELADLHEENERLRARRCTTGETGRADAGVLPGRNVRRAERDLGKASATSDKE